MAAGVKASPHQIPEGYTAVALAPDAPAAALQVCALVRKQADAVAGHLVVLRDTVDAQVLLGCLVDTVHQVHHWLEVYIQSLDQLVTAPVAAREGASGILGTGGLTNPVLDERFARLAKGFDQLDRALVIHTGWEARHPVPLFFDNATFQPVPAVDAFSNSPWALCQDDAVLTAKGLPAFSKSPHRYLYVRADAKSPLVPLTRGAPTNSNTVAMTEITGPNPTWVPLNPAAGLILVRIASPVAYEPFVDLLSGGGWDGILHGRTAIHVDGLSDAAAEAATETAAEETGAGRLFMGRHGKAGRFVENFHLKLRLLADAVAAVRGMTACLQRPVLNLTAGSFQVRLAQGPQLGAATLGGGGVPFLWTAQATLVDPGDAIALAVESADAQYYLRAATAPSTVYQPINTSRPVQGHGALRIRKVMTDVAAGAGGNAAIIEGTFDTQEKLTDASGTGGPTRNDLLWVRLNVGGGRVDLYGHIERDSALAAGEWRFRSLKQRLAEPVLAQLKAGEGPRMPDLPFEIVPLLSTPCDLYALAVLAVRTLLVNPATTLAIGLDEVLSLARQVAVEHNTDVPLGRRIRAIFDREKRFVDSLGPQRLWREEMTPADAFDLIPPELWLDTLGMILRMLPGVGPDSICRDYGDSKSGGPGGAGAGIHKAFDATLADLDALLLRSRSLIVIDWRFNREIHAVLRQFATGMKT